MNTRGEKGVNKGPSIASNTHTGEGVFRGTVRPVGRGFDLGHELSLSEKLLDAGNKLQGLHVEALGRWLGHLALLGCGHVLVLHDTHRVSAVV